MKKKILIGSIIAVALLTLVSFSSVVGYSSVESDSKIASPLFSIKNNKGDVSSNYLGKGRENIIPIPIRSERAILFNKLLNVIGELKEGDINKIIGLIIGKIDKDMIIGNNINEQNILLLYQIKSTKDVSKLKPINLGENGIKPPTMISFADACCPTSGTNPNGCFWLFLAFLLFIIFDLFYMLIDSIFDI